VTTTVDIVVPAAIDNPYGTEYGLWKAEVQTKVGGNNMKNNYCP
jgi:hypothetical protein